QLAGVRKGEYRSELAALSNDSIALARATIVFTSMAWKNAWKYEARSYRHWFWDGGVIAANLMSLSASMGSPTRIVQGFEDQTVNELLGVQDEEEATICLSPVGPDGHRFTDRQLKQIE